jgi:DNA repair exonuclease SbcCD ATPase subunit
MNRTTRFFYGLSLTTFSMGVFNTLRGIKTSQLEEQINKHEAKYGELNNKYTSLLEKNLNKLENEIEIIEDSNNLKKDVEVLEQKLRKSVEIKRELQNKYSSDENSGDSSINENIKEIIKTDEEIQNMYESVNNKFDSFINKINTLLNNNNNNKSLASGQYLDSLQSFFNGLNFEQNLAVVHISGSVFILISLINIISVFYGDKLIIFFELEKRFPKIAKFIQIRRKLQQYYLLINIGLIIIVLIIIIYINVIVFMSNIK